MITVKLHLNSIISTKGAWYCTIDLKHLHLMKSMDLPKFMQMKLKDIPPEFAKPYNLDTLTNSKGTASVKI
jgi:hypothetical protein